MPDQEPVQPYTEEELDEIGPTYNHSRADGAYDPCFQCNAMARLLATIDQLKEENAKLKEERDRYQDALLFIKHERCGATIINCTCDESYVKGCDSAEEAHDALYPVPPSTDV